MKKSILPILLSVVLFACNNSSKKTSNETAASNGVDSSVSASSTTATQGFDISNIKESTAELGVFPYLNPPESYKYGYGDNKGIDPKDINDFDKQYFAVNGKLFPVEGKSFNVQIEKDKSDGKRFNSLIVDKSYENAILALGGVIVNNVPIPQSEIERIGDKELIDNHFGYSLDYNLLDRIKTYIIKTKDKEVWIQYYVMNDENGRLTVLEKGSLKALEVTKVTADQMKSDIDKNGKAILNINFDTDKATLKPDGEQLVKEITSLLQSNPNLKLSIEGHTDNAGNSQKNKQLSTDRANTVLNSLVASGISKSNLKSVGFGSEKPLVANDTEENKSKNRRVELVKF